jgi:hypothetical protein
MSLNTEHWHGASPNSGLTHVHYPNCKGSVCG